jgi:hypothetical protein
MLYVIVATQLLSCKKASKSMLYVIVAAQRLSCKKASKSMLYVIVAAQLLSCKKEMCVFPWLLYGGRSEIADKRCVLASVSH